ncbi:MAG: hypothetical protein RL105_1060, partial [Verrucomicrobiota bacterium]
SHGGARILHAYPPYANEMMAHRPAS